MARFAPTHLFTSAALGLFLACPAQAQEAQDEKAFTIEAEYVADAIGVAQGADAGLRYADLISQKQRSLAHLLEADCPRSVMSGIGLEELVRRLRGLHRGSAAASAA